MLSSTGVATMAEDRDTEIAEEFQEEWVRAVWAAKYLDVGTNTIYRNIQIGKFRSLVLGPGLTLVSREQVLNWVYPKTGRKKKRE